MDARPPIEDDDSGMAAQIRPIRDGMEGPGRTSGARRRGASRSAALQVASGLTVVIAAAAGVAAGMARGAPTQIHLLDIALRVLLAVACVLAGRLTPWPFVAMSAIVATAASYRSPAALVAVGVLGIALVGWQSAARDKHRLTVAPRPEAVEPADDTFRRIGGNTAVAGQDGYSASASGGHASGASGGHASSGGGEPVAPRPWAIRLSVLRAASCGALAGVAVRASWPRVSLTPSLLAGVIVLLILVPAVVVAPRRLRKVVLRLSGVVALAVLLLAVLGAVMTFEARSPLRSALASARSGLTAAERGDQPTAISDFKRSEAAFKSAAGDLAWARAAEVVPVVSQQVRAISAATSVGQSLATAGVATASTASVGDLKLVNGVFPVGRLAALKPVFQQDLDVLQEVSDQTSAFASPWVVAPLRNRLSSIDTRLRQATHDARIGLLGAEQVPAILGANGLRTYLVLVENPAESRASGGVIGDFAEVTADGGRLRLTKVGSVEQLNHDGLAPSKRTLPPIPDFVDRYGAYFPQDHWENISMSPDFPTVGAVASYLYPQSGGVKLNGVISIDPEAMAGFLKMIGPVRETGLQQPISQSNVVAFLNHDEFVHFTDNRLRIKFVEALLKKVWHDLTSRSLPAVPKLVKDLEPAVKGGHLLMYSSSAGEESFFKQVHVAGAMPPVDGDFLGVVTQNGAGNKIDWYLRRSISYDATLNLQWRTITSSLTIKLDNTAPSSGEPHVVIDGAPNADTQPGENLSWVNVYSPWQLESATLNGRPLEMTSQYELGRQVYSAIVAIPAGTTDVLKLNLAGTWPSGLSHYELGWYHQPTMFKDQVSSKVTVTP